MLVYSVIHSLSLLCCILPDLIFTCSLWTFAQRILNKEHYRSWRYTNCTSLYDQLIDCKQSLPPVLFSWSPQACCYTFGTQVGRIDHSQWNHLIPWHIAACPHLTNLGFPLQDITSATCTTWRSSPGWPTMTWTCRAHRKPLSSETVTAVDTSSSTCTS